MPAITEPVPEPLRSELRRAVLRLRAQGPVRRFAPVLHLGRPDGASRSYDADAALGHGLRADVVAALLRSAPADPAPPLAWLTRPGELSLHDLDAGWLAAATSAYEEAGLDLTMVVVTRQGWWDPRSDVRRVWKRLRDRSAG